MDELNIHVRSLAGDALCCVATSRHQSIEAGWSCKVLELKHGMKRRLACAWLKALKALVTARCGIAATEQRLLWNGKELRGLKDRMLGQRGMPFAPHATKRVDGGPAFRRRS